MLPPCRKRFTQRKYFNPKPFIGLLFKVACVSCISSQLWKDPGIVITETEVQYWLSDITSSLTGTPLLWAQEAHSPIGTTSFLSISFLKRHLKKLCVCLCGDMCPSIQIPSGSSREHWMPWSWSYRGWVWATWYRFWEPNSSLLQEQ